MKQFRILIAFLFTFGITEKGYSTETTSTDYVVTLQNDTLFGTITPIQYKQTPSSILFQKNGSTEKQTYLPAQIKFFYTNDALYISAATRLNDTNIAEPRFLMVYNRGKASLYCFSNSNQENIFFIEKNDTIIPLIYSKIMVTTESGKFEKENLQYKRQMAYLLNERPNLFSLIEDALYYDRDLMRIIKKYNDSFASKKSFVSKKDRENTRISFGITTGLQISTLTFSSPYSDFDYLTKSDFLSVTPALGVYLNYQFPALKRRLSLLQELLFSYTNYEDTYIHDNQRETDRTVFDLSYLRLGNFLRYTFYQNKNFNTYGGGGIIIGLAIQKYNYRYNTSTLGATSILSKTHVINNIPQIQFGSAACIGTRFKKFALEYRIDLGTSITDKLYLQSKQITHFLNLQYNLK